MEDRIVSGKREYFLTGETLSYAFRKEALLRLKNAILMREKEICQALYLDLGKSSMESYMCEIGLVLGEIEFALKHLKEWMKNQRVRTPAAQFLSKSFICYEPLGVVLIMSPWNYPFMLALDPLVGAIAAGCCAVVKPASYAPHTSGIIARIVGDCFEENYISVLQGGREQNQSLLQQRFDYIFFTGSVSVGKFVAESASHYLTPVTLELGGKSPCIVDETADLQTAAKRIAFGKYLNCGQTCVAPDYLLIQKSVKDSFLSLFFQATEKMYGKDAFLNKDYGRIVNEKHFLRAKKLIDRDKCVFGGQTKEETLQIAPTVLDGVTLEDPVMQEEVFAPILPVLTYQNLEEAIAVVRRYEKPLALYFFSENKRVREEILKRVSFGGGCLNDTIIHLATSQMGFGGVGYSGNGAYHGKRSFLTFSHEKSIVEKSTKFDLKIRYQPYTEKKEKFLRRFY